MYCEILLTFVWDDKGLDGIGRYHFSLVDAGNIAEEMSQSTMVQRMGRSMG